jgi:hypothetical protein
MTSSSVASEMRLILVRILSTLTQHHQPSAPSWLAAARSSVSSCTNINIFPLVCQLLLTPTSNKASTQFGGNSSSSACLDPTQRQTRRSTAASATTRDSMNGSKGSRQNVHDLYSQLVLHGQELLPEEVRVSSSISKSHRPVTSGLVLVERMVLHELDAKSTILNLLTRCIASPQGSAMILKHLHQAHQRRQQQQKRWNSSKSNKSKGGSNTSTKTNKHHQQDICTDILSLTLSELYCVMSCLKNDRRESRSIRGESVGQANANANMGDSDRTSAPRPRLRLRLLMDYMTCLLQFWMAVTQRDPALAMLTLTIRRPPLTFCAEFAPANGSGSGNHASSSKVEGVVSGFDILVDALEYGASTLCHRDNTCMGSQQETTPHKAAQTSMLILRHTLALLHILVSHLENWDFDADGAPPYPFTLMEALGPTKSEALNAGCHLIVQKANDAHDHESSSSTSSSLGHCRMDKSSIDIATRLLQEYLEHEIM